MPVTFSFEIEGEKQFSRRLEVAADHLEDFSEPLENIGTELKKSFDENFASRGGLFGGWKSAAKNYGHPLLEDSGEMRGGFVSAATSTEVVLGNTAPYFPYHQSNKPRSKIPRRVMMKIDQQRKTYIVKQLQSYIQLGINK